MEGCSTASIKSGRSLILAVTSTVLFALCELASGITAARSTQLLLAALLCAVLAALHTHAVLGKNLSGWRLWQPFHGGTIFVLLQSLGWVPFSAVTLGVLVSIASGGNVPYQIQGFMFTLGIMQLLAQAALVASLAYFDSKQRSPSSEKGIPLPLLGIVLLFAGLAAGIAIHSGGSSRRLAGWAILASMLGLQAAGLHYMWTLTWNFMTICCWLMDSENALATMACTGVCSICAPWYIGRVIYSKYDFCERAMIGQSAWACDEILCLGGRFYMHKICPWPLRLTFYHFDTVLHLLAALVLLQQYGSAIRPIHALASVVVTAGWFFTLFLDHKVFDWTAFRQGRLRMVQWGSSSLWEPRKVAQIYMFENKFLEQDHAWENAVPGFASIIVISHIVMAIVAALPNAGEIFFTCGLGHYVSTQSLTYCAVYCVCGAVASVLCAVGKMAWVLFKKGVEKTQ